MNLFIVLMIVLPIAITIAVLLSLKRSGAFGMSKKQQQQAQNLMATGTKARAWILAIQPTGTVLNNINIQCDVAFRLEPLQGGQTYDVQKRMYLPQTSMPRIGEVWPSWFNPMNPNEFAVGQPNAYTQESLQVLREFGIATPFDPPRA